MSPSQTSILNVLLRSLSSDDYALLEPHLVRTAFAMGEPLFEPRQSIKLVHFLEEGVASIVSEQESGDPVETGLYGREGMSGIPVLLKAGQTPQKSFMQVGGGAAWTIGSEQLLHAFNSSASLQDILLRYAHVMAIQASSTAASNAQYALPERLARWLLMCHDRADGDLLALTHQFMGEMLAVRRSSVTVTLQALEATGAIRSSRGLVAVLDRPRLEEIAGDSYGEPEEEYRRLIGPFAKGRQSVAAVI